MLVVRELTVLTGNQPVVRGLSLQIALGETVALVGPNGAGKSTVGKAIAGLCPIAAGSIELAMAGGCIQIQGLPAWRRYRLGIHFHPAESPVFPDLSVEDNLLVVTAVTPSTNGGAALRATLDLFPVIRPKLRQLAGTLSGGEKRLLSIARAHLAANLVGSGSVLMILDEPTHGLAPIAARKVASAIRNLGLAGLSILLIEQNHEFAEDLANRVYAMESGALAQASAR